ncbi:MAG: DUF2156 domain-containing protein [Clostridia bacterium]|nr:DUF2156 domain-containing protein [Clostridia bacterium]
MIDFHRPTLGDKDWINEKINQSGFLTCEYTFGNIFSYCAKMDILVAEVCGCLVTRCCFVEDYAEYCFPVGNGDVYNAIKAIIEDGIERKTTFGIFGMNSENAEFLSENFGKEFDITLERDSFDYIYLSEDLINLKGKKYQPKRNHISFFMRNNNWSYEKITSENIDECLAMSEDWLLKSESEFRSDLENELKIIKLVFENYDALGYVGGLLRCDGRVVAYTMGERMNDEAFCVHFEKAYPDIRGAYPMINQQFVMNELKAYKYIDREDDVGAENLRRAKLSYHPALLPDKYEAVYKYVD